MSTTNNISNDVAIKSHFRTCTLCEAMCGIEIKTAGTKIISIAGDKKDPFSRGHICPKATALQDLHEDPDRLRAPVEKTSNGWKEISWEKAYSIVTKQIKELQQKHGKSSLGVYLGNPNVHNMGAMLANRFLFKALGTKNIFSATSVDQLPHHIVAHQLFGHQLLIPIPDIDRTDYFLIIGGNPMASNGSIMTVPDIKKRLKAVEERGGKVVVIDPRKTETADVATEHYFIKPNSDVLLLLAMTNLFFKNKLLSPGKLNQYTEELNAVEAYVQPYTTERVALMTGMSEADIVKITTDFANAKTGVIYGRMGVSTQSFGTLCQYFITLLNLLKGGIDQPGGALFTKPAANILKMTGKGYFGKNKTRVRSLSGFSGEFPVSALAEEILTPGEGQIKGMLLAAGNPVLSTPNGNQLDKAFASLDFMVSIDFYINESNRHASVILPPVGPLEREHYDIIFHVFAVRNTAKYSKALFSPQGKTKHDWEIYFDLAERLKKPSIADKLLFATTRKFGPSFMIDFLLRSGTYGGKLNIFKGLSVKKLLKNPHGIDLGPLQPSLPNSLYHTDKKIHLSFDYFMPDLKRVENHFWGSSSEESSESFTLIGRRYIRSNNSWLHNSNRMVKGRQRCTAMMHPEDAARLNIHANQKIKVSSRVGSIELEAELTDEIMKGVISIPHGWGHTKKGTQWAIAEQHSGVSVNDLTDELSLDELSGNAALNGVKVFVNAA